MGNLKPKGTIYIAAQKGKRGQKMPVSSSNGPSQKDKKRQKKSFLSSSPKREKKRQIKVPKGKKATVIKAKREK